MHFDYLYFTYIYGAVKMKFLFTQEFGVVKANYISKFFTHHKSVH